MRFVGAALAGFLTAAGCAGDEPVARDASADAVSDSAMPAPTDAAVAPEDGGPADAPASLDAPADAPVVDAPIVDVPVVDVSVVDKTVVDSPSADRDPAAALDVSGPEMRPGLPPPPLHPEARKLLGEEWELLGTHQTACSSGPASVGQRWCAISRPSRLLYSRELWVLNVSRAATETVACDGTSPHCVRLAEDLFPLRPARGPTYPEAHAFHGDTLLFHAASQSQPHEAFRGTVRAWRPGWSAARAITSAQAMTCTAHPVAPTAFCFENAQGLMPGERLRYDLHAGPIEGPPLPRLATLWPVHPMTGASSAQVGFNGRGDLLLYSTIPEVAPYLETLHFFKLTETAAGPIKVVDNASRWAISADQSRWFYLRDYNYNPGSAPSGTLVTSDFPGGANERSIMGSGVPSGTQRGVSAFHVLTDATGKDAGLGLLVEVNAGSGIYRHLPDVNDPSRVVEIYVGTVELLRPTADLRFGLFATHRPFSHPETSDFKLARYDGSGSCSITNIDGARLLGPPFAASSRLVFWAQNYEPLLGIGEGWIATSDCWGHEMYARNVDRWFIRGSELLLFSHEPFSDAVDLRFAPLAGNPRVVTTVLQRGVGRLYAVLPDWDAVVVRFRTSSPAFDGLYRIPLR